MNADPYERPTASVAEARPPKPRIGYIWMAHLIGWIYLAIFALIAVGLTQEWDVLQPGVSGERYVKYGLSILTISPLLLGGGLLIAMRKAATWGAFASLLLWCFLLLSFGFSTREQVMTCFFAATFAATLWMRRRGALR